MHHLRTLKRLLRTACVAAACIYGQLAGALPAASRSERHTDQAALQQNGFPGADMGIGAVNVNSDDDDMFPVDPFDEPYADVEDTPVDSRLQEQLLQQSSSADPNGSMAPMRSLLHGPARLKKYPPCNKCRMLRCNSNGFCTGHCRRRRRLMPCSSRNRPAPAPPECLFEDFGDDGEPLPLSEFQKREPDGLGIYDTAVVTVASPYIGCADIGNRPSGCPARGTAAMLPGSSSDSATVIYAHCRSQYYVPDCPGPLMPVGVCHCLYRVSSSRSRPKWGRSKSRYRRRYVYEPCKTTVLETGSGVGDSDGSESEDELVVVPGGDVTQTWFNNFTIPGQEPSHTHEVTVRTREGKIDATLTVYYMDVRESDYMGEGVEVTDESDDEHEPIDDIEEPEAPNGAPSREP
eukprot:jgi/Ulvmu1/2085/UM123_0017.1